ncbi:MAG: site-specific integrase [Bacteroidota bacterium]
MITFKSVVADRKRSDGTYQIRIRITHLRKVAYVPTPYYASRKDLNSKNEIINFDLLKELNRRIEEYQKMTLTLKEKIDLMPVSELVAFLTTPILESGTINLFEYFKAKIENFEHTKAKQTCNGYTTAIDRLKLFVNKPCLYADNFTVRLLNDFEIHLRTVKGPAKKVCSSTAIKLYMVYLSALCKIAETEDVIDKNPFRKGYKIPKANTTAKRNLEIETIRAIANDTPEDPLELMAHDVFMISFLLCGMNTVDLYYCPLAKKKRITYYRQKTKTRRSDKALTSILIPSELNPYLDRNSDKERLFNFHRLYTNPSQFNKRVNKGLESICERLELPTITSYWSRHSWATIARNDLHIPKDDIHFALNHSSAGNITDTYLAVDWSIIDRANRQVIDYLYQSKDTLKLLRVG